MFCDEMFREEFRTDERVVRIGIVFESIRSGVYGDLGELGGGYNGEYVSWWSFLGVSGGLLGVPWSFLSVGRYLGISGTQMELRMFRNWR